MRKILVLVVLLLSCSGLVQAQAQPAAITLTVSAGFDGYFRDAEWIPVIIHAGNSGETVSGRFVVRPETSGSGLINTYSTPVTLSAGAQQTVRLYVSARAFASQIRVELIDDNGTVVTQQEAPIHAIQPQDRLNVVISASPVGAVDLTGVHGENTSSYQANWTIADLPDRALEAVDLIMLSDVDSGALSSAQQQALVDWVAAGGELIVTGGQNWQATAAGVADLLPLLPDASREIEDLQPLAAWLRVDADLGAQTIVATGSLRPEAQVLVAGADDTPLLVRRTFGGGVVDYLAADPNNAPLRGWADLPSLWFTLITSNDPQPGWANGFVDWDSAGHAVEILPGYDPLPDILPLFIFLALYIALVGPLNYLILNRINRREWAWFTIPALILIFSVLSYLLGFNLRGNEATVNRIALVRSWDQSDRARVDELVGLLSPLRAQYSLAVDPGVSLRPIPRPLQASGLLTRSTQANIDVQESERFVAQDFNVDASFIAGFDLTQMIDKPAISGSASIAFDSTIAGQQIVRGSVRNDSNLTLTDPVILARGVALQFDQPLAPGAVRSFDLTLTGENPPAPALRSPLTFSGFLTFRSSNSANQSVVDILSTDHYNSNIARLNLQSDYQSQVDHRRQYFLTSLVDDYYGAAGRGDRIYLAGWSDETPLTTDVTGADWNAQNTTLYLVELASEHAPAAGRVMIAPDQFTWTLVDYAGDGVIAPTNLQLQTGDEVTFRYTPLPAAVLSRVDELTVTTERVSAGGVSLMIYLYNWATQEYEGMPIRDAQVTVPNPARFLGPQNAIQLRFIADGIGNYLRIGQLSVAQSGMF